MGNEVATPLPNNAQYVGAITIENCKKQHPEVRSKSFVIESTIFDEIEAQNIVGKKSPFTNRFTQSENLLERDDYGWFEEIEPPGIPRSLSNEFSQQPLHRALTLPAPVTETPLYILESSLETQQLWYKTAGRRPKQPKREREHFEKLWKENFEASSVPYYENSPDSRSKRAKISDIIPKSEIQGEILFRGKAPFSNSVSRSFVDGPLASMTLHMPYFRIVKKLSGEIHAEFLIVVTITNHNSPVTFGIWKRFSDFTKLAVNICDINDFSNEPDVFKNSFLSWQCVMQRKRWFKSLDRDYLALKCFLLERFIHDVLFECKNVEVLINFLELDLNHRPSPQALPSGAFF